MFWGRGKSPPARLLALPIRRDPLGKYQAQAFLKNIKDKQYQRECDDERHRVIRLSKKLAKVALLLKRKVNIAVYQSVFYRRYVLSVIGYQALASVFGYELIFSERLGIVGGFVLIG